MDNNNPNSSFVLKKHFIYFLPFDHRNLSFINVYNVTPKQPRTFQRLLSFTSALRVVAFHENYANIGIGLKRRSTWQRQMQDVLRCIASYSFKQILKIISEMFQFYIKKCNLKYRYQQFANRREISRAVTPGVSKANI